MKKLKKSGKAKKKAGFSRRHIISMLIFTLILIALLIVSSDTFSLSCRFIGEDNKRDDCYLGLAEKTGSMKICNENIISPYFRDECIRLVAVKQKDIALCDNIADDKSAAYCYESLAEVKKDPSICPAIKDYQWSQICYHKLALTTGDYELCAELDSMNKTDECYFDVAEKTGNTDACFALSRDLVNSCLWTIAKSTLNEEACGRWLIKTASDKANRDLCYKNLARRKQDIRLCDNINYDEIQEECIQLFVEE